MIPAQEDPDPDPDPAPPDSVLFAIPLALPAFPDRVAILVFCILFYFYCFALPQIPKHIYRLSTWGFFFRFIKLDLIWFGLI